MNPRIPSLCAAACLTAGTLGIVPGPALADPIIARQRLNPRLILPPIVAPNDQNNNNPIIIRRLPGGLLRPPGLLLPGLTLPGSETFTTLDRNGHPRVLEQLPTFQQQIEAGHAATRALGLMRVRSAPLGPAPVSKSLAQYQTGTRDQVDRGACWAFASVAAMEAFYKRQYNIDLDLSEEYAFHMGKTTELLPNYTTNMVPHENNSCFWGFQGSSDFIKALERMAIPEERFAPYQTQAQLDALRQTMPAAGPLDFNATQEQMDMLEFAEGNVPTLARANARYRVTGWDTLGDSPTVGDVENTIASNHEVVIDVNLRWKWDATKMRYDYDPNSSGGGHVMLAVGYDRNAQTFLLKNSFNDGLITVTYDFMKNNLLGGHYITSVSPPDGPVQRKAFWLGHWNIDHDGWRGSLVFRRFTDMHVTNPDAPTKLGNYYRDGKSYDVNGYFVQDGHGVVFNIADNPGKVTPGTLTGQQFKVYVFSNDDTEAAGETTWNNTPFGVTMRRADFPPERPAPFNVQDWVGSWRMVHDGWRGGLVVRSVQLIRTPFDNLPFGHRNTRSFYVVNASYTDQNGTVQPTSGIISEGQPFLLALGIRFGGANQPAQNFRLLYHTREQGMFSGTTTQAGATYAVQGQKIVLATPSVGGSGQRFRPITRLRIHPSTGAAAPAPLPQDEVIH